MLKGSIHRLHYISRWLTEFAMIAFLIVAVPNLMSAFSWSLSEQVSRVFTQSIPVIVFGSWELTMLVLDKKVK